jgi:hypothetical protein
MKSSKRWWLALPLFLLLFLAVLRWLWFPQSIEVRRTEAIGTYYAVILCERAGFLDSRPGPLDLLVNSIPYQVVLELRTSDSKTGRFMRQTLSYFYDDIYQAEGDAPDVEIEDDLVILTYRDGSTRKIQIHPRR